MSETRNLSFPVATNPTNKFVRRALSALEEMYKEYSGQVGSSKVLLKKIESLLENPLEQINTHPSAINEITFSLLNEPVKVFFKQQEEIIDTAFRRQTIGSLYYCILLKDEENFDNRHKILAFLADYEMKDFSGEFPIYFQFIPGELKNVIERQETII